MFTEKTVPTSALWLGFCGAIPFVAGVFAAMPFAGEFRGLGLALLVDYGAIILSFMGGVHWGAAMFRNDRNPGALYASVIPSLVALPAALVGGMAGLLVLAAGFAGLLLYDERETRSGRLPSWYPFLRRPLTGIVVTALVAGAAATQF